MKLEGKIMKKLLASLFLGITLITSAAEIVYITPKGKKYHERV